MITPSSLVTLFVSLSRFSRGSFANGTLGTGRLPTGRGPDFNSHSWTNHQPVCSSVSLKHSPSPLVERPLARFWIKATDAPVREKKIDHRGRLQRRIERDPRAIRMKIATVSLRSIPRPVFLRSRETLGERSRPIQTHRMRCAPIAIATAVTSANLQLRRVLWRLGAFHHSRLARPLRLTSRCVSGPQATKRHLYWPLVDAPWLFAFLHTKERQRGRRPGVSPASGRALMQNKAYGLFASFRNVDNDRRTNFADTSHPLADGPSSTWTLSIAANRHLTVSPFAFAYECASSRP